jgi:cytochrome o ubiquinol oxidase subunit 2
METQLHAVINKAGTYDGFSANYSGAGFSGMHFKFQGMSQADFDHWVETNKAAGQSLSRDAYLQLQRPSERDPVRRYASVAPGLYDAILNRCVEAGKMCMSQMMAIDSDGGMGRAGLSPLALTTVARGTQAVAISTRAAELCTAADSGPTPDSPTLERTVQ